MPRQAPALSVILPAPGGLGSIGATLDHLLAQTARDRLEIVIVTDGTESEPDAEACLNSAFASHRIVRLEALGSRAAANAEGFRHARCDIVAFAEDHCFPAPAWADALLRRHEEPWAAVGPAIENANPASAVSWCDLLINYGPWIAPRAAPTSQLPGHNTSYKRNVLARYEDTLAGWLEVEVELQDDMIRCGERLFVEPAAKVSHVNISRWSPWLFSSFFSGRIYAGARCRSWPAPRRALYAAAWPLIALVRLARQLASWPECAPGRARLGPVLLCGLLADAAGQALGYLAGAGESAHRMARYELDRAAHVRDGERAVFARHSREGRPR